VSQKSHRLRPRIGRVGVLFLGLLAACSSSSTSPSTTGSRSTTSGGAASPASSSSEPASLSQVLSAVAAASSVTSVPADLTPSLQNAANDFGLPAAAGRGCQPGPNGTSVNVQSCTFGNPSGKHTMVIVGDSHAGMWLPAFDLVGKQSDWRVIALNKVNCGAASVSYYLHTESRPYSECDTWHSWVFSEIGLLDPSIVVLTSFVAPSVSVPPLSPSQWTTGLETSLNRITSPGTKKVVLGDMPYLIAGGTNLGFSTVAPANCVAAHESNVQACSVPATQAVLTTFHDAEVQASLTSDAQYVDVIPWLCSTVCSPIVKNMFVYENTEHITTTYATYLSGVLQASLQADIDAAGAK